VALQVTRTVHIIPDVTAPSVPSITISQSTPNTISASWTPSTDDQAVANYLYVISQNATDTPTTATTSTQTEDTVLTDGLWYTTVQAVDVAGNVSTSSQVSTIIDTVAPLITLTGASSITQFLHTVYTDAGATALDLQDGDVTTAMVTAGTVDTAISGDYFITYDVTDAHGNVALQVTRTVHIIPVPVPPVPLVSGGGWFVTLDSYGYRRSPEPVTLDVLQPIATSTPEMFRSEGYTANVVQTNPPLVLKKKSIVRTAYALTPKEIVSNITPEITQAGDHLLSSSTSVSTQDATSSSNVIQRLIRKIRSLFRF
jgi:hypothetical protein